MTRYDNTAPKVAMNFNIPARDSIKPLNFKEASVYPKDVTDYFAYYGLAPMESVEHKFGSFRSQGYTLAAHCFIPKAYHSTVLLMHGYFEHSGLMGKLVRHLTSKGFLVALYDMPGHGLSSGAPAVIESFSTYSAVMEDFVRLLKTNFSVPLNIVGHSTGGSAVIGYLFTRGAADLNKIVLAAPLVRIPMWRFTLIAYNLLSKFLASVPRKYHKSSSDKAFLDFYRHDPLQIWVQPLAWVKALIDWNRQIANTPPVKKPMLVLQGTKDSVVEWKYNTVYIAKAFPAADIKIYKGFGHYLFNESEEFRGKVFEALADYLLDSESKPQQ
ncbi:MAG TPA: hypothetical protein DEE98_07530 [Elusimicrobia bacterium]|nr:hypothetical protein [Elusimicrobiota bacterium]